MQLNEEVCPVAESLLGDMYRATPEKLRGLIETVPSFKRALLAIYCRRRAHLASIGLALAANCDREDLIDAGGDFGAVLADQARLTPEMPRPPKITLSSAALMHVIAQDLA
ncbi:MAG: hypothetical protein ABI830_02920 [Pseudolabrys sp.]